MRIVWLVDGVAGDWSSGLTSPAASNRYRAIIPATELRQQGHSVEVASSSNDTWADRVLSAAPDVVVVSKQFGWQSRLKYEELARYRTDGLAKLAQAGVRVVVDFCDDHFSDPFLGPHWRRSATAADLCIAGSPELQETVRRHTTAPVEVVGDPIASPKFEPAVFKPRSRVQAGVQRLLGSKATPHRLRLVWYGSVGNLGPLLQWADELAPLAADCPWWLTVVTNPAADVAQRIDQFNRLHRGTAVMELVPWSEEAQWRAVEASDLVLIPAETLSPAKRAKTANRLTDALHAGRAVIASPLPSYLPFASFACLADDPKSGFCEYVRDPEGALTRVRLGQAAAIESASATKTAASWLSALQRAAGAEQRRAEQRVAEEAQVRQSQEAVRLNLGCGDKILEGYVNVDVVESRAGKSPDVICDLHRLSPFPDNHADELLAVHVVEHFWRWEIEAVLREWVRVLKPGGRMVLECPNLATACEEFLANQETGSRADSAGQRTMWVFYGDPRWQDPLMVHRWGYTPKSLATLMAQCGLINARQEPAQFKLREPRDMRIVADKPA